MSSQAQKLADGHLKIQVKKNIYQEKKPLSVPAVALS
jgi:hypothetical protein